VKAGARRNLHEIIPTSYLVYYHMWRIEQAAQRIGRTCCQNEYLSLHWIANTVFPFHWTYSDHLLRLHSWLGGRPFYQIAKSANTRKVRSKTNAFPKPARLRMPRGQRMLDARLRPNGQRSVLRPPTQKRDAGYPGPLRECRPR